MSSTAASTKRLCPYCGAGFSLEVAPIVSTSDGAGTVNARVSGQSSQQQLSWDDDDREGPALEDEVATNVLANEAAGPGGSGGPRTLWEPPKEEEALVKQGFLSSLAASIRQPDPDLKSLDDFSAELMARRACPECLHPLPADIDDRQVHLLAVVGLNSVGKTHYIGASMVQASRQQGLRSLGFSEFAPDVETAPVLHQDFFVPLFRRRTLLDSTQADRQVRYRPLSFKVTHGESDPWLLMTHDVSGEAISDHRMRAQDTPFLRWASAVIFLVDPMEFDSVHPHLPADEAQAMVDRYLDQVDLLAACINELKYAPGGEEVPIAVTVSKADVLSRVLGREMSFDIDPSRDETWLSEIERTSDDVKQMLLDLGESNLVETASAHGRVTFHAVSPLGSSPDAPDFQGPQPLRCLEPLAMVLSKLASSLG